MIFTFLKKRFFYIFFIFTAFFFFFVQNIFAYVANEKSLFEKIKSDYTHYYSKENILPFTTAFSVGAICANTKIDENIKTVFQDKLRSEKADEFSKYVKFLGDGKYVFPVALLASSLSLMDKELIIAKWGGVTLRSYIVGLLPMVLMQRVTGASRPDEDRDKTSHWRFVSDENGVSGHAFVGAVPFLTMAKMTDNKFAKTGFYLASTATAWSRINDNAHYFSQTLLGWYMAYKSVDAVFQTEDEQTDEIVFFPIIGKETYGFACSFRF